MFPLSDKLMVCFKEDRIQMLKIFLFCIRTVFLLAYRLWTCVSYLITKQTKAVRYQQTVKYENYPLSPLSMHRLSLVRRKVFVLDLDETLIHSNHDGVIRQANKPNIPPDFVLRVTIERHPVRFFVHKRPFVDFFLDIVSQWYELVVFTASMEVYGAGVADKLDNNRGILKRRYYRQHCTPELGSYTKDLSAITGDLSNIFILDNSPGAYKGYPDNAIPIKSWFCDQSDTALLGLLPVLDALRFTHDVRSVLSRKLHLHRLWSVLFVVKYRRIYLFAILIRRFFVSDRCKRILSAIVVFLLLLNLFV